jgi:hypothetical protein
MSDVESIEDDDDLDELPSGDETDEEVDWFVCCTRHQGSSHCHDSIRSFDISCLLPLYVGCSSTTVAKVETVEGSGWFTLWVCRGQQFHFQEKAKI